MRLFTSLKRQEHCYILTTRLIPTLEFICAVLVIIFGFITYSTACNDVNLPDSDIPQPLSMMYLIYLILSFIWEWNLWLEFRRLSVWSRWFEMTRYSNIPQWIYWLTRLLFAFCGICIITFCIYLFSIGGSYQAKNGVCVVHLLPGVYLGVLCGVLSLLDVFVGLFWIKYRRNHRLPLSQPFLR